MDRKCCAVKTTEVTLLEGDNVDEHVIAGVAHSCLRGWRLSMEDEVVMRLLSPRLGCFAVLDGHGGQFCSRWGAAELPRRLEYLGAQIGFASDADEARHIAQQLSEVVCQMDADLRKQGLGRPRGLATLQPRHHPHRHPHRH